MSKRGKLIVLSGPSGAGKSTVVHLAEQLRNDICFSVSVTTRAPRPGETDGKDYFFIDQARFDEMVCADELLEHATYVAHSYGTPKEYVESRLNEGWNVVLDIEVQGAGQVHEKMPDAVMIFVAPPSLSALKERLVNRGTETMETINARIERARHEYEEANFYDYIIINDVAEKAAEELSAIITAAHCSFADRKNVLEEK